MAKMSPGEMRVWSTLSELAPKRVCTRAKASFDEMSAVYNLKTFGSELKVSLNDRKITVDGDVGGDVLLKKLESTLSLTALWYLTSAKDIPLSNRLIKPVNLPGGRIFDKGSHVLPLDEVADRYGGNSHGFLAQGKKFGGEKLSYGDASIRLFPLPRIPTDLILWEGDEEFPANVNLLLDDTCILHMPTDIIWSTCLMSVMVML